MKAVYVGIAVFALGFIAGAGVNGWRVGQQKAEAEVVFLKEEVNASNTAFEAVKGNLKIVIDSAEKAADKSTKTLAALQRLDQATNAQFSAITSRTQRVSHEINQLGVPKCQYTFEYGSLYESIGKAANSGRYTLYGPDGRGSTEGVVRPPVPGTAPDK